MCMLQCLYIQVDNSTQMPYRRDDGCVEVQRCKKFTDKLHHLMPRLGKALQKQCDMPNGIWIEFEMVGMMIMLYE